MTDHLPTAPDRMEPQSRAQFVRVAMVAFSREEATRLSGLPISILRQEIAAKSASLGAALTRDECDEFMRDMALVLPASGVSAEDAHHKLDLYFVFLKGAGMTAQLLAIAGQKYVMAPRKGKPKFFPDPGQLVEMVHDELLDRKQKLAGLQRGLDVVNGLVTEQDARRMGRPGQIGMILDDKAFPDRRQQLAELRAKMESEHPQAPRPRAPSTARAETPESRLELVNSLHNLARET